MGLSHEPAAESTLGMALNKAHKVSLKRSMLQMILVKSHESFVWRGLPISQPLGIHSMARWSFGVPKCVDVSGPRYQPILAAMDMRWADVVSVHQAHGGKFVI